MCSPIGQVAEQVCVCCRLKMIHTGEKTYPWVAGVMWFGNSGQCDKLFSHDTKSIIRVGL